MSETARPLSVEDAGAVLGVSSATVWRMIRRGELPTVRRNGRRLVLSQGLVKRRRQSAGRDIPPLTRSHPIFKMIGAGRSGGRPPGASDKHAILDE